MQHCLVPPLVVVMTLPMDLLVAPEMWALRVARAPAEAPAQAERLTEAGYLCEGAGYSGPSFQWSGPSGGYHVVYWCDTAFAGAP